MERTTKPIVYLDTHIVCWLYEGTPEKLSQAARNTIVSGELFVSPMVDLELQYLYEIGRITEGSETILSLLAQDIELQISRTPFAQIVVKARSLDWGRDPFDRLIVAEVLIIPDARLVTRDRNIREHCQCAVW
jgi:PIN domain nuclease of toxin-antitoxin system